MRKPEPTNVRGTCTEPGCERLQKRAGTRNGEPVYKLRCRQCHQARHGIAHRHPKPPAYRESKDGRCCRCGFEPDDPCQLDVDHVDGDHSNDDPENHQTLCANCHRLKTHCPDQWPRIRGNAR